MKTLPQYIAGYVLAALVVIATVVLLALHEPVPAWFEALAVFSAGGSTGAVIAGRPATVTPASSASSSSSVVGLPPVSA